MRMMTRNERMMHRRQLERELRIVERRKAEIDIVIRHLRGRLGEGESS